MVPAFLSRIPAVGLLVLGAFLATHESYAQGTLIPVAKRRDMVFDQAGNYLYITTSDGWVKSYNLATDRLEAGFNLGGSLNGADIAPDDSFLLVAQRTSSGPLGIVHKIDLQSGTVSSINYTKDFLDGGVWDIGIAANGLALFTTLIEGSGAQPLRQIDLATNAVTVRREVNAGTQIHRSADRRRFYFLESDSSDGPVFTYDAGTNSFGRASRTNDFFNFATAAVNRDGTLVSTLLGMDVYSPLQRPRVAIDTAPDFHFVRGIKGLDSGMAFDPRRDIFYGVSASAGQIIAYDTGTFAERFRLQIGESVETEIKGPIQFGTGTLVASPDGRYLALATPSGVRLFRLPVILPPPAPTPAPTLTTRRDMVFDHSGRFLYITTSTGLVQRYILAEDRLEIIADLGGSLNGLDISPDDSCLLIAQDVAGVAEGTFQRLDLLTGNKTNINFARTDESGAWDVAIGSNGLALVTTRIPDGNSGTTFLRQIDLATNAISIRGDVPGLDNTSPVRRISQETQVHRSADGSRFYFLGSNSTLGPIFTYSATTNTFGPHGGTETFLDFASAAVNRNGSLLATRHGSDPKHASLDRASDFALLQTFKFDAGVAFDAVSDLLYAVDTSTDQVIVFDTNTFAERYRIDVGEDVTRPDYMFGVGILVASNDGRYLALTTPSGIKIIPLPTSAPAPMPKAMPIFGAPRDMVFDRTGSHLYITTGEGLVWPYNLSTKKLESPYDLGGSLNGVDIAADDSFLIVAQAEGGVQQGRFHRLDLASGVVTQINYTRAFSDGGGGDVAIAANGLALVTTQRATARQIDPSTNTISLRTDGPPSGFYRDTQIRRSADRTRICFIEDGFSARAVFSYSTLSNTISPPVNDLAGPSAAVNRTGSLLGTQNNQTAFLTALPSFAPVHSFDGLNNAVVFDAQKDVLYAVNTVTDEIVGYDTNTFAETARLALGEDVPEYFYMQPFRADAMAASPEGRYLAYLSPTAVRIFDLSNGTFSALSTGLYLANISTRSLITIGDSVAIAGFIITGTDPHRVVLRATGPSLAAGLHNAMLDTRMELYDGAGALIAQNNNWKDAQEAEIRSTGLAPRDDREGAIVRTLAPGAYTAVIRGENDSTGIGLVELYDVDPNANSALSNISTRGVVETGDNVLIAGIIINPRPSDPESRHIFANVLVRAIGPSLMERNVANALQDPTLELYDSEGTKLASNDDWKAGFYPSEIAATGLAPTDDRESTLMRSLAPGNYTAIVRGKNNSTGVGLIEVYHLK